MSELRPGTRTRPSSSWSGRSACCCGARGRSPPGWPVSCTPTSTARRSDCSSLLQDAGPLRASDLVARLGLDKSTVSRQVASLVDLGLVDRGADPDDGRAQVLTPSAEGAARLAADPGRPPGALGGRPPPTGRAQDVATLAELLHRLNRLGDAREARRGQGGELRVPRSAERSRRERQSHDGSRNVADTTKRIMVAFCNVSISQDLPPCPSVPSTRDRLTASVAQLIRTGRHVSTRAATQLYGDLPSFGWALLVPARAGRRPAVQRAGRASSASTSRSPAGRSPSSSGRATSSAAPTRRTAGPACSGSPRTGAEALRRDPGVRADWAARRARRLERGTTPRRLSRSARPPAGRPRGWRVPAPRTAPSRNRRSPTGDPRAPPSRRTPSAPHAPRRAPEDHDHHRRPVGRRPPPSSRGG